jgi:hypothetical protein
LSACLGKHASVPGVTTPPELLLDDPPEPPEEEEPPDPLEETLPPEDPLDDPPPPEEPLLDEVPPPDDEPAGPPEDPDVVPPLLEPPLPFPEVLFPPPPGAPAVPQWSAQSTAGTAKTVAYGEKRFIITWPPRTSSRISGRWLIEMVGVLTKAGAYMSPTVQARGNVGSRPE